MINPTDIDSEVGLKQYKWHQTFHAARLTIFLADKIVRIPIISAIIKDDTFPRAFVKVPSLQLASAFPRCCFQLTNGMFTCKSGTYTRGQKQGHFCPKHGRCNSSMAQPLGFSREFQDFQYQIIHPFEKERKEKEISHDWESNPGQWASGPQLYQLPRRSLFFCRTYHC